MDKRHVKTERGNAVGNLMAIALFVLWISLEVAVAWSADDGKDDPTPEAAGLEEPRNEDLDLDSLQDVLDDFLKSDVQGEPELLPTVAASQLKPD